MEIEEKFYLDVASLLGTVYSYKEFPYARPTRWNNRKPGNGRFPGFGLVRMFSPTLILVCLKTPRINMQFASPELALDHIEKCLHSN